MVTTHKKVFLIAGSGFFQRKQAIDNIKKKILLRKQAPLNVLTFYSKEIDIKDLQEKILTFSFDKDKIIIFKDAYRLSRVVKDFLFDNFEKIISNNYMILEIEKDYFQLRKDKKISGDKFFNHIFKEGVSFRVSSQQKEVSLEDFKRSIRKKDLSSSLYFLERLFKDGNSRELGPLILGILVREFSYFKQSDIKEKCFSYLWDTDRAIKERGIETQLAIELLIVKAIKLVSFGFPLEFIPYSDTGRE
jgi:hypothetical protein